MCGIGRQDRCAGMVVGEVGRLSVRERCAGWGCGRGMWENWAGGT